MNDEVFWQLIDQARTAMIEDPAENMQALDSALRKLSPEELMHSKSASRNCTIKPTHGIYGLRPTSWVADVLMMGLWISETG